MANFHKEIFTLTQKLKYKLICIMAFRGSGKSTIMNLSYVLWSILGKPQKKFIIIVSKRKHQARAHFENIKRELETNELLKNDMGPFKAESDDQGSNFIEIKKFNAKIMMISARQGIRGLRYGINRPDLIVLDDIEDNLSMENNREQRQIYEWFMSEVIPSGDANTTIIVLGNRLKGESLLTKLEKEIKAGNISGIFHTYPIVNDRGQILWLGKFPNKEIIKNLYDKTSDMESWMQEYALISKYELLIETQKLNRFLFDTESKKMGGKTETMTIPKQKNIINRFGFDIKYLKLEDGDNGSKTLFRQYLKILEIINKDNNSLRY